MHRQIIIYPIARQSIKIDFLHDFMFVMIFRYIFSKLFGGEEKQAPYAYESMPFAFCSNAFHLADSFPEPSVLGVQRWVPLAVIDLHPGFRSTTHIRGLLEG
ncbi:hypothetical protein [Roseimicrobium sp. ORNL1]|uniref:hypothetical protein n=1 Tax=Roseimicrobium sp. ORNL1 TaxID=2711231 RepID=UPI0013E12C59|nr:hypothetical protein [Roseimicrobium sp. ORNL1]QIF00024.1 hypothetical protein G5S37_00285 [Roseimicrobium sp. ORNL1]